MHTRGLGCEGEVTKAGACTIKKIQQSKKALAVFMKCQSSKSLMCEYFINTCWGGGWRMYSRTSHNRHSDKRTTSLQRTNEVLRIEIAIVLIHKQPPRGRLFSIPGSRQDSNSQRDFSIQSCL